MSKNKTLSAAKSAKNDAGFRFSCYKNLAEVMVNVTVL